MNGGWEDRRKARRVDASLNLEIQVPRDDGSLETTNLQTINISSSGVYFRSDRFLEPMTKLAMRLDVAVPGETEDTPQHAPVECEGLVVRVDPEVPADGLANYEIAVFFTRIEDEGVANLERHIEMLLDTK